MRAHCLARTAVSGDVTRAPAYGKPRYRRLCMRSLLLAWGAIALMGCGEGHSQALDAPDAGGDGSPEASAPDTGTTPDAAPDAGDDRPEAGQPEAGPSPPTCTGQ